MKKFTMLLLFFSSLWGYSQVKNYTFLATAGTYDEISDGLPLGDTNSDDQFFVDPSPSLGSNSIKTGAGIEIGFDFIFNGFNYNRFGVQTNGTVFLGSST